MWKSDPCYASYGVDGSVCSFIMFLSEVSRLQPFINAICLVHIKELSNIVSRFCRCGRLTCVTPPTELMALCAHLSCS